MRVLVTGAGGFVGSRLAVDLAHAGHTVTGVWHNNRTRLPTAPPDRLVLEKADLADRRSVSALFSGDRGFDAVVHAAGTMPVGDENVDYLRSAARVNVLGQAHLLAVAADTACRRFLFTSTISVYGDRNARTGGYRESDVGPASYYGWSKRAAEELLDVVTEKNGLCAITLRLAGVHGIGRQSGALYAMARAALDGSDIIVNEAKSVFRWALIDDVSRAVISALEGDIPRRHHVANIASADTFTLYELAQRVKDAAGSESVIRARRAGRVRNRVMRIDVARRLLGFEPTSIAAVLPAYLANLRGA